jgi:hypothetical protein
LTRPPALAGASSQVPSYEDLAIYLRTTNRSDPHVAAAERKALLELLMPTTGRQDPPAHPPIAGEPMEKWFQLLDSLANEGVLAKTAVEAERAALDQARQQAALP